MKHVLLDEKPATNRLSQMSGQVNALGRFTPVEAFLSTHCIGGCSDGIVGLDRLKQNKISYIWQESNYSYSDIHSRSVVTIPTEMIRLPLTCNDIFDVILTVHRR